MSPRMNMDSLKQHLTNPQRVYLWEFEIPSPKGVGDTEIWILRAQSASEPGRSFDPIDIPFKGTGGIRVPGIEKYSHELVVRLLEGTDAKTYIALQSWMKLVRDNVSGTGLGDPDLKSDAVHTMLDNAGNVTKRIKIIGMYPQAKGDIALNYSESAVAGYDVTFAYDRWEEVA